MQLYNNEFNQAIKKAEEINDREFKGHIQGKGELFESKNNLLFRFLFKKDTDGCGFNNERIEEQNNIINYSNVPLFIGVTQTTHTHNDNMTEMTVDVVVIKPNSYDKYMYDNEQKQRLDMLNKLRGR